jgi:DNA-binding NarL/FixJ family response regulator
VTFGPGAPPDGGGLPDVRCPVSPTGRGSVAKVMPLRVLVAEDQLLLREGLSRLLTDSGFEVVAQAGDAVDLQRKVAAHRADVAIIDVQMPPDQIDDGLRAAIQIRHPRLVVPVADAPASAQNRHWVVLP